MIHSLHHATHIHWSEGLYRKKYYYRRRSSSRNQYHQPNKVFGYINLGYSLNTYRYKIACLKYQLLVPNAHNLYQDHYTFFQDHRLHKYSYLQPLERNFFLHDHKHHLYYYHSKSLTHLLMIDCKYQPLIHNQRLFLGRSHQTLLDI